MYYLLVSFSFFDLFILITFVLHQSIIASYQEKQLLSWNHVFAGFPEKAPIFKHNVTQNNFFFSFNSAFFSSWKENETKSGLREKLCSTPDILESKHCKVLTLHCIGHTITTASRSDTTYSWSGHWRHRKQVQYDTVDQFLSLTITSAQMNWPLSVFGVCNSWPTIPCLIFGI